MFGCRGFFLLLVLVVLRVSVWVMFKERGVLILGLGFIFRVGFVFRRF